MHIGAKIAFENEDEIFISIGMKAGKQNGGRGLLNVMETVIINPLSEFIFERADMLRNRQIHKSLFTMLMIIFRHIKSNACILISKDKGC